MEKEENEDESSLESWFMSKRLCIRNKNIQEVNRTGNGLEDTKSRDEQ